MITVTKSQTFLKGSTVLPFQVKYIKCYYKFVVRTVEPFETFMTAMIMKL